jgi:hypothetical protein
VGSPAAGVAPERSSKSCLFSFDTLRRNTDSFQTSVSLESPSPRCCDTCKEYGQRANENSTVLVFHIKVTDRPHNPFEASDTKWPQLRAAYQQIAK